MKTSSELWRFVPVEGDAIRLLVLNGVGEPGIGEEVARILIPSGFRLMSSENANRLDYEVTKILAATEVVVGRDFAGGK